LQWRTQCVYRDFNGNVKQGGTKCGFAKHAKIHNQQHVKPPMFYFHIGGTVQLVFNHTWSYEKYATQFEKAC
jgi:hypothetical protein